MAEANIPQQALAEPGQGRPTVYDGKYRRIENRFGDNVQTLKIFPPVRLPETMKLADSRKFEEKRVVDLVAKEAAKRGLMKISFKKEIKFQREKAERGPNGEIQYEKMKHFFQPRQHLITNEMTKKEIRDLYRKDLDEIQEEIEQWT